MQSIRVELGERTYPIHIGAGILDNASLYLPHLEAGRAAIVTNTVVAPLYLERLRSALGAAGIQTLEIVVPDGERAKDWRTLDKVLDALLAARCDRQTPVIALGGGVVGDLAGFAAAVYQRGVPFLQVPTTLLAQVDSSVGGKTAINHRRGKNLIGSFHQPRVVLIDTDTLGTLPDRELSAGLAEVIKHAAIADAAFFGWLEGNIEALRQRDAGALAHAIRKCCQIKARVVAEDERETGRRALLNFGHTFGHAIEHCQGYGEWLHGEAVAAGMLMAARFGGLPEADIARLGALIAAADLPTTPPATGVGALREAMGLDKKARGGKLRFILLRALGDAYVTADYDPSRLERVLEAAD